MIEIRQAEEKDCYLLAPRIRQQDLDELEALGVTPLDSLLHGLRYGVECYTAWENNSPITMFGVSKQNGQAIPWLLGSDELNFKRKTLCQLGKKYVNEWIKNYRYLSNFVYIKNIMAIEWLKYLGATFDFRSKYGVEAEFYSFSFGEKASYV
ncbi:hypothetical protein [Spartinivicinus ruber]|uniref:hypothetical protein n=1 Tax=Spartinivicinus ruber TaxID=2683272 RepID=UPI0013D3CAB0|nr:hypothetical protein [Spartinivicinus ruber]